MAPLHIAICIVLLLVLIFMVAIPSGINTDHMSSNNYAYWLASFREPDGRLVYDQYGGIAYEHRDTGMF